MSRLRHRAALALTLLLALAGLLVAGCGDDDESSTGSAEVSETTADAADTETYADDVRAILEPLSQRLEQVGAAASTATSDDATLAALQDADAALSESVEQLGEVEPPAEVADLHEELVGQLEDYLSSTGEAADVFGSGGSRAEINEAAKSFEADSLEFAAGITELVAQFLDAGVTFEDQP